MGHNVYFVFCLLSLVMIAPFGTINPIIALIAIIIAGIFFFGMVSERNERARKRTQKSLTNNINYDIINI